MIDDLTKTPPPKKTNYILVGPSGSGKSTLARKIYDHLSSKFRSVGVASADHMFEAADGSYLFDPDLLSDAHDASLKRAVLLAPQSDVIVDNTNTSAGEVIPYIRVAQAFGHRVVLIFMNTPIEVCLKRGIHGTPEHVVRAQAERRGTLLDDLPPFILDRCELWDASPTSDGGLDRVFAVARKGSRVK